MSFFDLATRLIDKIRPVREVIATLPEPQQKMINTYGNDEKLVISTWPNEKYLKFWLLDDGTVIPVGHAHHDTCQKAGVSSDELRNSGAYWGHIDTGSREPYMAVSGKKNPTSEQIEKLKSLFIKYQIKKVSFKSFYGLVKSSEHLSYLLTYGEIDETKLKEDGAGAGPSAGPVNGPAGGGATTEDDISALPTEVGRKRRKRKKTAVIGVKENDEIRRLRRVQKHVAGFIWPDGTFDTFPWKMEHEEALDKLFRDRDKFIDFVLERDRGILGLRIDHVLNPDEIRTINEIIESYGIVRLNVDLYAEDLDALPFQNKSFEPVDRSWSRIVNDAFKNAKPIREAFGINEDFDEYWERYYELQDEIDQEVVNDWMKQRGKPDSMQPWDLIPSSKLKKIYNEFARSGVVHDEKSILEFESIIVRNVQKISANTRLMGHDTREALLDILDSTGISEDDLDGFEDYCVDRDGEWRVSDYAVGNLATAAIRIMRAKSVEDKLIAIDMLLNIVHSRSDLSSWFVEGGRSTLDKLAGMSERRHNMITEAVDDDLSRLRKELKTQMVKLVNREEFQVTADAARNFQAVFGVGAPRTQRVAIKIERQQKDAQKLYGDLLREHGDDKGSIEMLIAAMQEGRPLGQFTGLTKYDYLYGTRIEVKFQGIQLFFESKVDFIYDPTQSLYVGDDELVDKIEEELGRSIKRRKNLLYPVGGKFQPDFFEQLKSMMSDSVEEPKNEE